MDDVVANHFIDENDNIAFGRAVDMENNKIFSLPKPTQDNEPATKKYVDDLQTQHVDKKGNIKFGRNINVGNNRIFALKDPKKDYEAANKKYVDESITKSLEEEKDKFLPQDPATKQYVDEAIKGLVGGDVLVSKEGVFIKENGHYRATAPLDIDNQKMENLPEPLEDGDAVNKKYVDGIVEDLTLKQGLVRENGGFNLVDSYINMNFNNIRNVGYPKHNEDAVPRSFVDDIINSLKEKIEKRKHVIAVSANYRGLLKTSEYQFSFGGGLAVADMGFLMPQSGRIKKVKFRMSEEYVLDGGVNSEFINLSPVIKDNIVQVFSFLINRKKILDPAIIENIDHADIIIELLSIKCELKKESGVEKICFLPFEENLDYQISEGDSINIKTMANIDRLLKNRHSYLFTLLIELDSLDD